MKKVTKIKKIKIIIKLYFEIPKFQTKLYFKSILILKTTNYMFGNKNGLKLKIRVNKHIWYCFAFIVIFKTL